MKILATFDDDIISDQMKKIMLELYLFSSLANN